jgi:hypothetical protein
MVRNGPIKRQGGAVPAQLGVSVIPLLLPPLVMAASVALFAYFPSDGARPKDDAKLPVAPESTIVKNVSAAPRPDGTFVVTERKSSRQYSIGERMPTEQHATTAEAGEQADDPFGAPDPATRLGPVAVTLVRVSKAGAAPAIAALGPPPSTAVNTARPSPVFHPSMARSHAFHARGKVGRHEPRALHVAKHQRPHAPSGTVRGRTHRG